MNGVLIRLDAPAVENVVIGGGGIAVAAFVGPLVVTYPGPCDGGSGPSVWVYPGGYGLCVYVLVWFGGSVSSAQMSSEWEREVEQLFSVTMVYEVAQPMPLHWSSQGWEVKAVTGSWGHLQCWVRVLRTMQRGTAQVRQRLVVEVTVGQAGAGVIGGGVMVVVVVVLA